MSNEAAFIAAHRFGFGPRPGELRAIAGDPRGWLRAQIGRQALPDGIAVNAGTQAAIDFSVNGGSDDNERRGRRRSKELKQESAQEIDARLRHRVTTQAPFAERLVAFWTNHFSLSVGGASGFLGAVASTAYEREAIRPFIFEGFEALAFRALTHPAMVMYLDNERNIGPNSIAGERRNSEIVENLAREVLELYVMGVDGGYSQEDVEELSRILTGWGYRHRRTERFRHKLEKRNPGTVTLERYGEAEFFPFVHEPGAKTLLGVNYEEAGADEFRQVIRDLTRHPATARFISTKLAQHFIADAPPRSAVDRLTNVFRETEGDLAALSLTLIQLDEAWQPPLMKAKTPNDYVIASGRALEIEKRDLFKLDEAMAALGQPLMGAPDPRGWPDTEEDWFSPAKLLRRIEWTQAMIGSSVNDLDPRSLLDEVIGPVASDGLRRTVRGAPSTGEGVALVLLSPEFQRR